MKHFEDIEDIALDNYGLFTARESKELGIAGSELNRWVRAGRIERLGQGVYRLMKRVPTPYDRYAEACALAGRGACLYGESVLEMLGLGMANPRKMMVAVPDRARRSVPAWMDVLPRKAPRTTFIEGIPAQMVGDAILSCRESIMTDRLVAAAESARSNGYITKIEYEAVMKELANGKKAE